MHITPTHVRIERTNLQLIESMQADRHGDRPVTVADAPCVPGSRLTLAVLRQHDHDRHLARFGRQPMPELAPEKVAVVESYMGRGWWTAG